MTEAIDQQLPLDIPLSHAPRERHATLGRIGPHSSLAMAQSRLAILGAVSTIAFLVVALRLIDATMFQANSTIANYGEPGGAPMVARADITDRNGQMLATSLPAQSLYADPAKLLDPVTAARGIANALPGIKFEEVLDKLTSAKRFVWIKRNLTPDEVYKVNALGQPGLEFQEESTRLYPAGTSTVHVLGYTDVDGKGLSGLERALNGPLAAGGAPITSSIDLRVQHIMERELSKAIQSFSAVGGAGMVMDMYTGEMLAAVSLPDFAPGQLATSTDEERFNRFSLGTYELGSVMKVITTAAGLESGHMTLDTFYDAANPIKYGRFTINDYHPEHRALSVAEVFIYSSNIGAARMAMDMGPAFQREFMCKVGLCEPVKTELMELGTPQIPANWSDISSMTIAFGHGISVTPLHLMQATAATLTGNLVTPTFLKRDDVTTPQGVTVVSPHTVDLMHRVFRANVVAGSGKSADVPGYFVGGKTGTAEKTQGRRYNRDARLSSFIGAFPMNKPRYLVYAMIDEPRPNADSHGYATGGWVAAPVVGNVIAQLGPLYGMAPADPNDPDIRKATQLEIRSRQEEIETY